jgi:multiphosphoryl transfer protein
MIQLGIDDVRLGAKAADKTDAIRQAGSLLVQNGFIKGGYIDSMLGREKVANTFLGNGIAIPHGLPKDRHLIMRTGISVVQFPDGVKWNPGEVVYLVVGIAACSDEHLEVLANLTGVLDDKNAVLRISATRDPHDVVACLNSGSQGDRPAAPEIKEDFDFSSQIDFEMPPGSGLHARPAAMFVEAAKRYKSEIRVRFSEKSADGKSLVSLLQLGVPGGTSIRLMARGEDANAALKDLVSALDAGLVEAPVSPAGPSGPALSLQAKAIPGIAASPGKAIGPLHFFRREKIVVATTAADPAREEKRMNEALESARANLLSLHEEVRNRSGAARAAIFLAHAEFLSDPDLIAEAREKIESGHSAGWSWRQAVDLRSDAIAALDDPLLKERAADLRDVGRRVLRLMADSLEEESPMPDHPVILAAEDLSPSDTARLDPLKVLGICTAGGGATSHTAILARSLGIPAIAGCGPVILRLREGIACILDGDAGSLYADPGPGDLAAAADALREWQARREAERLACYQPAFTTDGHRIEIAANIGNGEEAAAAVAAGAEGIGLLRTEFLYLDRYDPPTEDEQFQSLQTMVGALNGLPLIVRTLDIGGDKELPYLSLPPEANPFLGLRGIRLCLAHPELFRPQLRAIYRASVLGPVKIMFPMISSPEELVEARRLAENVRAEMGAPPVEIGIMIEVPSAVLMARELAAVADFFSVGTNDLTQYVLAMDRGHPVLARQADALHPAVLRMIDQTVKAAHEAGKWVGVCGAMAGDPAGAAILLGLGVDELSVGVPGVAAVKARVRELSLAWARDFASKALACRTSAEVRALRIAD